MLTLFSNVRMGISLGLVEDISPRTLNSLMVEASPNHLANGTNDPRERDILRAKTVRTVLESEV